jgi:hypothetical protein
MMGMTFVPQPHAKAHSYVTYSDARGLNLNRLPLALRSHQRAFDNHRTTGGNSQDIAFIIRKSVGNDDLNGIEAGAIVNVHERKASLAVPPRAYPALDDYIGADLTFAG